MKYITWYPTKLWRAWYHDEQHEGWRDGRTSSWGRRRWSRGSRWTLRRNTTRSCLQLQTHQEYRNSPQAGITGCISLSARTGKPWWTTRGWRLSGRGCRLSWCSWWWWYGSHLEEVVGYHDVLDVVWLSVFHKPRPCEPYHIVVEGTQTQHWPGGGHEQPVVHSANQK